MTTPGKPQLTDEQRAQLKAMVKASVRDMLRDRDELQDKATTMRQVWQALVASPTWSIVQNEQRPVETPDEIWSLTPTVNKQ